MASRIRIALFVVPRILDLTEQEGRIVDAKVEAIAVALLRITGAGSGLVAIEDAAKNRQLVGEVDEKTGSHRMAAPLGRSSEVIAGQHIEPFVNTPVYLVLKNSLSAASCPTFSETFLLPHCFSK
ncbi:hypothetical protein ACVWY5_001161 [Bradyrhizobium sp. USDA 3256]